MFGFGPVEFAVVGGLSLVLLGTVIGGMAGIFYLMTTENGDHTPERHS